MDPLNNTQFLLSGKDIRAMVGILGDVAASQGDHTAKKRLLMDELGRLIRADSWVWALTTDFPPGKLPVNTSILSGGFRDGQFPRLLLAQEHPDYAKLLSPVSKKLARREEQSTFLRHQYDPTDSFEECESKSLWQSAGVDLPLLCFRPVAEKSFSSIAFYRAWDSRSFDERTAKIVHIVLGQVEWIHEQGWPWSTAVRVPELTARTRQVLALLLEGIPRKEIADKLCISEHTVNDHAKKVYRFFDVHSHAELVSRFRFGG